MNRRTFFSILILMAATADKVLAEIWAKPGPMSYRGSASPDRKTKKEMCLYCAHFKDDKKFKDGGLCTYRPINKGKEVYVKKEGHCSAFKRKV